MQEEIVKLSNGTEVKCTAIPVWMWIDVQRAMGIIEPEEPKKKIESVAGHVEEVSYNENDTDEEWLEYKAALKKYKEEDEKFVNSFPWDAGVIAWRLPGEKKFTSSPPKDWVMPAVFKRISVFSEAVDANRVSYIKYSLLADPKDNVMIANVIYNGTLLSSKEVGEAVNSFQD